MTSPGTHDVTLHTKRMTPLPGTVITSVPVPVPAPKSRGEEQKYLVYKGSPVPKAGLTQPLAPRLPKTTRKWSKLCLDVEIEVLHQLARGGTAWSREQPPSGVAIIRYNSEF